MKDTTVRARIEPELKASAEEIFAKLGLSTTQAITLFYRQVELQRGLPFAVVVPNAKTRAAMKELERGKGESFNSVKDLLEDLQS